MDKTYHPQTIEQSWYQTWEERGYFKPQGGDNTYSIMIPPPNVTGNLHLGHGFNNAVMDAMIRYHRMKGDDTLWQNGHRPRGHCHADGGGAATGRRGPGSASVGARAVSGKNLAVESRIRWQYHPPIAPPGFITGLEPRALHHG